MSHFFILTYLLFSLTILRLYGKSNICFSHLSGNIIPSHQKKQIKLVSNTNLLSTFVTEERQRGA